MKENAQTYYISVRKNVNKTSFKRHYDPDEGYDHQYSYEYHGIKIIPDKSYFDVIVQFEPVRGRNYYLLVVDYNTGDSYNSESNCHRIIELFDNKETANIARKYILEEIKPTQHQILKLCEDRKITDVKNIPGIYSSFSINANGELCIISNADWTGHCESLNEIKIIELKLVK